MTNPAATPCLACGATWNKGQGGAYKLCATCRSTLRWCPRCKMAKEATAFGTPKTGYCRPCNADKARERLRRNPDYTIFRTHGITLDDKAAMARAQGDRCAICDQERKLVVDHCHTTGRVRALLCDHCNQGLGRFFDDPDLLVAAISYLKQHQAGGRDSYVPSREAPLACGYRRTSPGAA